MDMIEHQPTVYKFTLLRHGESVGNAENYHQGQSEFELTEKGLDQSRALAERWRKEGKSFDAAISSPLARARQTAEIIANALSLDIEYDSDWMERDNGLLAGLHHTLAAQKYPQPKFINPFQHIGETGEGEWQLYLRAGRAVLNLLHRKPGSYLIVSHGGLLNMVFYVMLGIAPQANFQGTRFRFHNTGFSIVEYDPACHTWTVDRLNDRSHLLLNNGH
jgi:2,3-bisphosphoglycerate-dependent phosphoglycerate mutase